MNGTRKVTRTGSQIKNHRRDSLHGQLTPLLLLLLPAPPLILLPRPHFSQHWGAEYSAKDCSSTRTPCSVF